MNGRKEQVKETGNYIEYAQVGLSVDLIPWKSTFLQTHIWFYF